MKQAALPSFSELSKALTGTSLNWHASQVHGLVSGIICGNQAPKTWEELSIGGEDEKVQSLLQSLYAVSSKELKDFLFEFQLLLPEDEASLSERADALTLWCQGFLTGLKMAGVDLQAKNLGEASEAIQDLVEIANLNSDDIADNEEDEKAYTELLEYVRVAVILIYQTIHQIDENESSPQLH